MSMWSYYREHYAKAKDAVEATDERMLNDPRVQMALAQIEMGEAYLDKIMGAASQYVEEDD